MIKRYEFDSLLAVLALANIVTLVHQFPRSPGTRGDRTRLII